MTEKDKKIIFFGSPVFAIPALKALYQEGFNLISVITQPPKRQGRRQIFTPTAVEQLARQFNLPVELGLNFEKIKQSRPNLGVVVAYGKLISQKILEVFTDGCLNIHPSLLPKYRGPAPIQAAILNGDAETGVCLIKLDKQMDHGPIIKNLKLKIENNDTYLDLAERLAKLAADLLIESLPDYLAGKITPIPQNDDSATYTKLLTRADGKIDWKMPAKMIEKQIRAFQPWPGCFAWLRQKSGKIIKIKIITAQVKESATKHKNTPGTVIFNNHNLEISCGQGGLLIDKLQVEGKKNISVTEFLSGYREQIDCFIVS